jgi:hypothetical protein
VKLSHARTEEIFYAAAIGASTTVVAICQSVMPSVADPGCVALGGVLMRIIVRLGAPDDNDCLGIKISTRLALPPWKIEAGYVDCR